MSSAFSRENKLQAYISFVQSLMDYHLLPTWPMMTNKAQLEWTRVRWYAAAYDFGSFDESLRQYCPSRGWNPASSRRFRLLLFKRAFSMLTSWSSTSQILWLAWEGPSCSNSVASHLWSEPRIAGSVSVGVSHRESGISQDQSLAFEGQPTSRPARSW
jgi:hypothetical protein